MRLEPWAHPERPVPLVRWVRPGRREPCPQQEHLEQQVHREPWERQEHPEQTVPLVRWVRPEPREPCLRQERPEHSERQVPSVHLVQKVQQARPVRREPSGH